MHESQSFASARRIVGEAVKVAHSVGIERVSVSDVFVHGPDVAGEGPERGDLDAEGPRLH